MRFDNHLGLKHTNAEPLLFCCLKGAEKRGPYESRAHPASIVSDRKDCPTVTLTRLNSHLASRSDCIAGVEKQVGDYTAELIPVHFEFWLQVKLLHDVYFRRALQDFKRVSNKQIKVQFHEFEFEASQGTDAADKLVDAICGFTDPTQGIFSKNGVIKMHRQILKRQTQG